MGGGLILGSLPGKYCGETKDSEVQSFYEHIRRAHNRNPRVVTLLSIVSNLWCSPDHRIASEQYP